MSREQYDDPPPLVGVGELLLQRPPDVVREGADQAGVVAPTVDEAPRHLGGPAAIESRCYIKLSFL